MMNNRDVFFSIIEAMWLFIAVVLFAFGIATLNGIMRWDAEISAAVAEYVARQRVIAAVIHEVTREAEAVMMADSPQHQATVARNHSAAYDGR